MPKYKYLMPNRRRSQCQMKQNATQTLLIALSLLTELDVKAPLAGSGMAQACLPRVGMSAGRPLFWPLFGRDQEDEPARPYDKEAEERQHWTTNDWIEKHKYALELHNVTTADGYRLQVQRMPQPGQRPVLLVHGLLTSSLSWVLMGPRQSLAFLLYDKQYDVWLANMRGSSPFGRNHTRLSVADADFWRFSFHEWGAYDLPAIIDHIRNESSSHQVLLIGHSQAFNAFLVLCSLHPEYNERILLMQALAPIVELRNNVKFDTKDVQRLMKFVKTKTKAKSLEIFPAGDLQQKCLKPNSDARKECLKTTKLFAGAGQHSKKLDPIIYGQLLQGGSLKQLQHLQQLWKSGDFVAYDYDPAVNRRVYNTVEPLNYDLQRVTVPMLLHFGETDAIATPAGVHRIYARLLHAGVVGVYRVAAAKFNHLDFLCAPDVKTLVNDKVIDLMTQHFTGTLKYVIE